MWQNQEHRSNFVKSAEVWFLAVLLVVVLDVAFYSMGLGMLGLLVGLLIVMRLFKMTGRGGNRWGL
jgi:hypothetical protein